MVTCFIYVYFICIQDTSRFIMQMRIEPETSSTRGNCLTKVLRNSQQQLNLRTLEQRRVDAKEAL